MIFIYKFRVRNVNLGLKMKDTFFLKIIKIKSISRYLKHFYDDSLKTVKTGTNKYRLFRIVH